MNQTTVARAVSVTGVGLRSGATVVAHLRPAGVDAGRCFRVGGVEIPATVEHVVDATLATVVGRGGARVALVEHLLAACLAVGLDNVVVEVEGGDELPILDGTALGWLGALARAGLRQLDAPARRWTVSAPTAVSAGESHATLHPAEELELEITVEFPHPQIGRQRWSGRPRVGFGHELAWARTFGFARDAERLRAAGLVRGASLENTLVFADAAPMNPGGQRAVDEVVRHKALDAVGDLALMPGRPCVRLVAHRGGHALHHALLRALP
jgi:UDP-3-O-[3-hydroxymyristoyl] N-acetylglucosamine deacetylase